MNNRMVQRPVFDQQLIVQALVSLQGSTGITGEQLPDGECSDGRVLLHLAGTRLEYRCEIKRTVDRMAQLDDIKVRSQPDQKTLLITTLMTSAMAGRCQELGIEFIDTAGNAFLKNGTGILIHIAGRNIGKQAIARLDKAITPAALRMMFAFLAEPSMLNQAYREISMSVQVSTGAIGPALQTLEARGFIGTTASGRRIINSPGQMLSEWATGYASRLRPKLTKFKFSAPDAAAIREQWCPELRTSAWGGEVAAEMINGHLKPSTFTIYMDMDDASNLTDCVKRFRLRADPQGPIEIVQAFWNPDYFAESFPTVPLHLIYADLLATNDSRNLEVARQIYQNVIDHVHRSQN